jgi:DNA-binding response OmpR family regulator
MRVLLVGAEQQLSALVAECLSTEGLQIDVALTESSAIDYLVTHRFAAVIMDMSAPNENSRDFLKRLRSLYSAMPILALTSQSADERVISLRCGADDCLAVPFVGSELSARIHALLRRTHRVSDSTLRVGDLSLDLNNKEISVSGRYYAFSARETATLEVFLRYPNRVVPKKRLEMHLYGLSDENSSNATDVCVHRLRRRLLDVGADVTVETIRGVGYIFRGREAKQRG